MNRHVLLLILITFLSLGNAAPIPGEEPRNPTHVNMFQLVVSPEKFDGRRVVVTGFLLLGSESSLLFAHQEDEKQGILENGISIIRTKQMRDQKAELNLKYVRVVGTFKLNDSSKPPFTSGTLTAVERCDFWADPDHPMTERLKQMPGVKPNQ